MKKSYLPLAAVIAVALVLVPDSFRCFLYGGSDRAGDHYAVWRAGR